MKEIINHAQRLAPSAEDFLRALERYACSKSSTAILRNAVRDLIEADGVICGEEHQWAQEFEAFFADLRRIRPDRSIEPAE